MFHGSIVALITPFLNGKVDFSALQRLVEWHIQQGTQVLAPCGSTGEGALLTLSEREAILKTVIQAAQNRLPVIAGCGAPSTHENLALIHQAQQLGAAGVSIVTPYYVKPSSKALYTHFKTLHDETDIPIIIYNNPGRVIVDISLDLIESLAQLPRIVGFKDSHTDVSRMIGLRARVQKPFAYISGEDALASAHLANGATGWMSVSGNVAPALCRGLISAWQQGDLEKFCAFRDQLDRLHRALGTETNPIPIKFAVSQLGFCQPEMRLPLIPASPETQQIIKNSLTDLELAA